MDIGIATAWEAVVDAAPDNDALVQGSRRVTYAEFDDTAARFADALARVGVPREGKVALYLYNSPEYMLSYFGALKHRAIPVNVNYRYMGDELAYLIDNSDSDVLVYHRSLSDRIERVRPKLSRLRLLVDVDDGEGELLDGAINFDDLIASHEPQARQDHPGTDITMTYTGGTTGMPKGVMARQGPAMDAQFGGARTLYPSVTPPTTVGEIAEFVRQIHAAASPVGVPCCPLMHATGMGLGAMPTLTAGGTLALLTDRHFNPHELWQLAEVERASLITIVGDPFARPMLHALEEPTNRPGGYDTSALRAIISSGAIWSAEVKDGLRERTSAVLIDMLGSTEGGVYALSSATRTDGAATARFILAPTSRVIDENGAAVVPGSGVEGLLAAATNTIGYFKDPEKSAKMFRELDGQSYVLTGDWATVDADGAIKLLGRGSNCIHTGGEKVYPEEVEEAIKRHPDVEDCYVVGVDDAKFGQSVAAVASSRSKPAPSGDEIREWLLPQLARYKVPRTIVVLDALRRAPNGKADYGWARETVLAARTNVDAK